MQNAIGGFIGQCRSLHAGLAFVAITLFPAVGAGQVLPARDMTCLLGPREAQVLTKREKACSPCCCATIRMTSVLRPAEDRRRRRARAYGRHIVRIAPEEARRVDREYAQHECFRRASGDRNGDVGAQHAA